MSEERHEERHEERRDEAFLVAIYADEKAARRGVEALQAGEFPMDQVSLLGRARSAGDDLLGIYHAGLGERVKAWGTQGAFWGGLWGLLAGAAGMFILPGIGPVMVAGPMVEAIAGAAVAGGTMAGAAALSHLVVAMRRMGLPEERLEHLQEAVREGRYVLVIQAPLDRAGHWERVLEGTGVQEWLVLPGD